MPHTNVGNARGVETEERARPGQRPSASRSLDVYLSVAFLILVTLACISPALLSGYDPLETLPKDRLQPPSFTHWFGTDHLGRDVYTRVVHGARISVLAGLLAVTVALILGSIIGVVAGSFRGPVETVLMRFMDVLLAVPSFLLSLTVVLVLGYGAEKIAIAIGLASIPQFARVMRSEVLKIVNTDFVDSARISGHTAIYVLGVHVIPNASRSVLVLGGLTFGSAMLSIAALSFLGYGAPPPAPEWGSIVSEARDYLTQQWWMIVFPGLAIAGTVFASNRVSRALSRERKSFV